MKLDRDGLSLVGWIAPNQQGAERPGRPLYQVSKDVRQDGDDEGQRDEAMETWRLRDPYDSPIHDWLAGG